MIWAVALAISGFRKLIMFRLKLLLIQHLLFACFKLRLVLDIAKENLQVPLNCSKICKFMFRIDMLWIFWYCHENILEFCKVYSGNFWNRRLPNDKTVAAIFFIQINSWYCNTALDHYFIQLTYEGRFFLILDYTKFKRKNLFWSKNYITFTKLLFKKI